MQLEEAKIVSSERSGYAREVTAHINRLKSVELFEENEDLNHVQFVTLGYLKIYQQ